MPPLAGWNISCDAISLSPSLLSFTLSPLPWGSISYDPTYTRRTRRTICAFTSTDNNRLTMASLLSACQQFSVQGDYLTLCFSPSRTSDTGVRQTWWMNEWPIWDSLISLYTGHRVDGRFNSGKTFPSLWHWLITLPYYAGSGYINAAAYIYCSGLSF